MRIKDKKPAAIVALLCAAVFIAGLIMFVGSRRDPFARKTDHRIVTVSLEGQASVIRRGTGYSLKEDIGIIEEDSVITDQASDASFKAGNICSFFMDENTQLDILKDKADLLSVSAVQGTLVFDMSGGRGDLNVSVPPGMIIPEDGALFSVECYPGTQTVYVYRGSVSVPSGGRDSVVLSAGERMVLVQDDDGKSSSQGKESITIEALSAFLLKKLPELDASGVFTAEALSAEAERRVLEVEKAMAEKAAYDAELIARGETVPLIESTKDISEYMTEDDIHLCTISIYCRTVLDNMDKMLPGEEKEVPEGGVILAPTAVQFIVGESVFDVLKRACTYTGTPLKAKWAVKFGGYYIEGIGDIYEFDCGPESGWMYKVNDWFPGYGCSNYILKEGDIIVWEYTCVGLGEDIGCYRGL